jgi:hypothetical protein
MGYVASVVLLVGMQMSGNRLGVENEGAKPRDHVHSRHHFWKRAHRDWRVWCAVALMLALMVVYVVSDNLSLRPGKHPIQPTPEAIP